MHRIALFAFAATLPALAHAATLRTHTLLHGPDVLLSDLFADAGPNAHRRLGPSPAPGGSIVVEAAQLGAIARQFDVDWRPASSGDRAVLERPGRPLSRDAVLTAVRHALRSAGAAAHCDVTLPGFSPPIVPAEADPHLAVSQLDYDTASGRFTAVLSVTGAAMEPENLRLVGRAEDTVEVPVAVTRLPIGSVLDATDLRLARVPVSALHGSVARTMADAVGLQLRRPAIPGQPLARADLVRPNVVKFGAVVLMMLNAGGLSVVAQGMAMQSGAAGDHIRVMNTASHAVIEAIVSGPGKVRVLPNSMPLPARIGFNQVVLP